MKEALHYAYCYSLRCWDLFLLGLLVKCCILIMALVPAAFGLVMSSAMAMNHQLRTVLTRHGVQRPIPRFTPITTTIIVHTAMTYR